jgi:hypothetical protein
MRGQYDLDSNKSKFLYKIYSKINDYDFSIKNLLASFNTELFTGFKFLKVFYNPIKKGSPLYIEGIEKNIEKIIIGILKNNKISIESINFELRFLKIFHSFMKIPNYLNIKNSLFKPKKFPKDLWRLNNIQLDYIILSKMTIRKNKIFQNKNCNLLSKKDDVQKKIRIDNLNLLYDSIFLNINKKELKKNGIDHIKALQPNPNLDKKQLCYNYSVEDILIKKKTKDPIIIVSLFEKKIQVLSHKNEKLTVEKEELKKKFKKLNFLDTKASVGYDKNGNVLIRGNKCQILSGEYRNLEGFVLFPFDGVFFIKLNVKEDLNIRVIGKNCILIDPCSGITKKIPPINKNIFVCINKGQFKGYKCRVLKIEENFYEVTVLSTSKIIKISKKNIDYL